MKVTPEYLKIITAQLEYFRDKKISELTDDEIHEFINLRKEITEVVPEVKKIFEKLWSIIRPYAEASVQYSERVLNRKN